MADQLLRRTAIGSTAFLRFLTDLRCCENSVCGSKNGNFAVQTGKLSSKVTHANATSAQPASRTSFSDTTMSCKKTAVLLKLSNVTFAEFFTLTAKMLC